MVPSLQLSYTTSVFTNYMSSILSYLFVTFFHFKYQFHKCRESERPTPLGVDVSTGAKPQITYFLQPPTSNTHVHMNRCGLATRSRTSSQQQMDGLEAEPERLVRAYSCQLIAKIRCASTQRHLLLFSSIVVCKPQDKQGHKTTAASVAGNDPLSKNLGNDIPRPFVAVKITVAHSKLHVCPAATCAGAV